MVSMELYSSPCIYIFTFTSYSLSLIFTFMLQVSSWVTQFILKLLFLTLFPTAAAAAAGALCILYLNTSVSFPGAVDCMRCLCFHMAAWLLPENYISCSSTDPQPTQCIHLDISTPPHHHLLLILTTTGGKHVKTKAALFLRKFITLNI